MDAYVSSLNDKMHIIELREEVYARYHSFSLARLLSEDYYECALAVAKGTHNYDAALSFYENSIYYLYEEWAYVDNDGMERKQILNCLYQRYLDLAYLLPDEFDEKEYAGRIAAAFEHVKKYY